MKVLNKLYDKLYQTYLIGFKKIDEEAKELAYIACRNIIVGFSLYLTAILFAILNTCIFDFKIGRSHYIEIVISVSFYAILLLYLMKKNLKPYLYNRTVTINPSLSAKKLRITIYIMITIFGIFGGLLFATGILVPFYICK